MLAGDPVTRQGTTMQLTLTSGGDGSVVVTVAGELDTLTAPDLRAALDGALADPTCRRLVLDLSGVTFLSSAGLSVLVTTREDTRARSIELQLAGLTGNRAVRRPLELTGLIDLFNV
jgi:anti-sigma B factor antagonist